MIENTKEGNFNEYFLDVINTKFSSDLKFIFTFFLTLKW